MTLEIILKMAFKDHISRDHRGKHIQRNENINYEEHDIPNPMSYIGYGLNRNTKFDPVKPFIHNYSILIQSEVFPPNFREIPNNAKNVNFSLDLALFKSDGYIFSGKTLEDRSIEIFQGHHVTTDNNTIKVGNETITMPTTLTDITSIDSISSSQIVLNLNAGHAFVKDDTVYLFTNGVPNDCEKVLFTITSSSDTQITCKGVIVDLLWTPDKIYHPTIHCRPNMLQRLKLRTNQVIEIDNERHEYKIWNEETLSFDRIPQFSNYENYDSIFYAILPKHNYQKITLESFVNYLRKSMNPPIISAATTLVLREPTDVADVTLTWAQETIFESVSDFCNQLKTKIDTEVYASQSKISVTYDFISGRFTIKKIDGSAFKIVSCTASMCDILGLEMAVLPLTLVKYESFYETRFILNKIDPKINSLTRFEIYQDTNDDSIVIRPLPLKYIKETDFSISNNFVSNILRLYYCFNGAWRSNSNTTAILQNVPSIYMYQGNLMLCKFEYQKEYGHYICDSPDIQIKDLKNLSLKLCDRTKIFDQKEMFSKWSVTYEV